MEIKLISNSHDNIAEEINSNLQWAKDCHFAVAYANSSAYSLISEQIELFLKREGSLKVIFDIEKFMTDKSVIEEFATLPGDSQCKVYYSYENEQDPYNSFHTKFYLFYDNTKYCIIIGSSNFTLGGFKKNIELNVSITNQKDSFFKSIIEFFKEIWTSNSSISIIDHPYILENYHQIYTSEKRKKTKKKDQFTSQIKAIIESKSNILNESYAYLLGLISANSEIDFDSRIVKLHLDRGLVNKGKANEGIYYYSDISDYRISQFAAHEKDCQTIKAKIQELIKALGTKDTVEYKHIKGSNFEIIIKFTPDSIIFNELLSVRNLIQLNHKKRVLSFIPTYILDSHQKTILVAFLRGYFDLKSRVAKSDGIYSGDKINDLRVGISISNKSPEFFENLILLLKEIGINKMTHTSKDRGREILIRISVRVIPNELISTPWRRTFIAEFKKYLDKNSEPNTEDQEV